MKSGTQVLKQGLSVVELVRITLTNELPEMTQLVEYFQANKIAGKPIDNELAVEMLHFELTPAEYKLFKGEFADYYK